jgi:hypothetical protein
VFGVVLRLNFPSCAGRAVNVSAVPKRGKLLYMAFNQDAGESVDRTNDEQVAFLKSRKKKKITCENARAICADTADVCCAVAFRLFFVWHRRRIFHCEQRSVERAISSWYGNSSVCVVR